MSTSVPELLELLSFDTVSGASTTYDDDSSMVARENLQPPATVCRLRSVMRDVYAVRSALDPTAAVKPVLALV
jgi:hypothetical protein